GFTVTLSTADNFGNATSGYGPTTLTSITSSDPKAVLPAPSSVAVNNSSGSFSATLKTAGSQTISVSDGTISGTSASITVVGAPATKYSVTGPSSATSGSQFRITVKALDQFGNVDTSYAGMAHFTST